MFCRNGIWRKRSAEQAKNGEMHQKDIAAKNFGARRVNAVLPTLDARLESRGKEVLHEKKGEMHKARQIGKHAKDENRHPLSPCKLGNLSRLRWRKLRQS